MATLVSERLDEPWRRRLLLPAYQIAEAANYAQISPQTVVAWHRIEAALLKQREARAALSYMQLIEVAGRRCAGMGRAMAGCGRAAERASGLPIVCPALAWTARCELSHC